MLVVLHVASQPADAAPQTSGLPLPRFVSLQKNEANMRAGPGLEYPIEWTYLRRDLPLEVIAEYRSWRKVRDWEGNSGWIHQSMLDGRRTLIVTADRCAVRGGSVGDSPVVAIAETGVVGHLIECPRGLSMCRVQFGERGGWIDRETFWGIHEGEVVE